VARRYRLEVSDCTNGLVFWNGRAHTRATVLAQALKFENLDRVKILNLRAKHVTIVADTWQTRHNWYTDGGAP